MYKFTSSALCILWLCLAHPSAAESEDHGVMTKADITMAAVDRLGGLVNIFGQRIMDDLDELEQVLIKLPSVPKPAPKYDFSGVSAEFEHPTDKPMPDLMVDIAEEPVLVGLAIPPSKFDLPKNKSAQGREWPRAP